MAKRIIKETYKSGRVKYRVENNRLLGFIPWFWKTETYTKLLGGGWIEYNEKAIFDSQEEAEKYLGDYIINKDEIWQERKNKQK